MPVSIGPAVPTESSTGVPAGGFSQWFRNIGDWIKSLSPAGASQYDTGWVVVPLNTGFQSFGTAPSVRRIGKEVLWRGAVQPNPAGNFTASTVHTVIASGSVPADFRPVDIVNRMASAGQAAAAARANIVSAGKVDIVTGPNVSNYYDLSTLSGYTVD